MDSGFCLVPVVLAAVIPVAAVVAAVAGTPPAGAVGPTPGHWGAPGSHPAAAAGTPPPGSPDPDHSINQWFVIQLIGLFHLVCLPHLVDLSLLLLGGGGQGGGGRSSLRRMTQPEIRVTEVSVALDVMKRLPDQTLLLQETLICHQQVQVALRGGGERRG